jgi:hypothetical protein
LPAQFQAGVFIESNAVDIRYRDSGVIQAISKGIPGKCLVILYPGKSFFLSSRNNATALHQATGGIMVTGGNAYDVQQPPQALLHLEFTNLYHIQRQINSPLLESCLIGTGEVANFL